MCTTSGRRRWRAAPSRQKTVHGSTEPIAVLLRTVRADEKRERKDDARALHSDPVARWDPFRRVALHRVRDRQRC